MNYHYPYQPTSNHRSNREKNNNTSGQAGYYDLNGTVSSSDKPPSYPSWIEGNYQPYQQTHPMPYNMQNNMKPESDLERRLDHISSLLIQLINQNNEMLRHIQNPPEQSQTVSTPGGGSVIVRM